MTPKVRWVFVIVGLLVGNLIAMMFLIVSARMSGAQVIPAYYERAVRFDNEIDDATRSRDLGWRIGTTAEAGRLEVDVRDASGVPIIGARVHVAGYHRARASGRFEVELRAAAPGRYQTERRSDAGVHDLVISIERADAKFVHHVVVEVR